MRREQLVFLISGLAFGILVGYGLFHALNSGPAGTQAGNAGVASPAGPPPPQVSADGAPMMAELRELRSRLEEDPDDLNALLRVGDIYRQVSMWEEAGSFYARAVEAHGDQPGLSRGLANLLHDNEQWERAIAFYESALKLEPEDPDLLTDMGICYRGLERFDGALELFARASAAQPEHWQALFNTVVVAAFDLQDYARAEQALQRLEQLRADAPEVKRLRAEVESRKSGAG